MASMGSGSSVSTMIGSLEADTSGVCEAAGVPDTSGLFSGVVPADADGVTPALADGSTSSEDVGSALTDGFTSPEDVGSALADGSTSADDVGNGDTSVLLSGMSDTPGLPEVPGFALPEGATVPLVFGVSVAGALPVGAGVTGITIEVSADGCVSAAARTVTLHLSSLPPTLALITVLPGFLPFTFPFLFTVAIFFLLLDHFTFFFPAFLTRSFKVFPTRTVAFLRFSFGFLAAVTDTGIPVPVTTIANVMAQAAAFNTFLFLLIFTPHFLIILP